MREMDEPKDNPKKEKESVDNFEIDPHTGPGPREGKRTHAATVKPSRNEQKAIKERELRKKASDLKQDMVKLELALGEALLGKDESSKDKAVVAAIALRSEISLLNEKNHGGFELEAAETYLKECKKILYKHQSDIMSAPETWNQIKSRFAAFMNRYFNAGMDPKVKESGFISQAKPDVKAKFFTAKGYGEKLPKSKKHKTEGEDLGAGKEHERKTEGPSR